MTRGRPPGQALREAKVIARRQGRVCENTKEQGLLYDFSIHLALLTICVRVKRLKTLAMTPEEILPACGRDIAAIRRVAATAVLIRELWVRSAAGKWRYFLVLDDRLVEMPEEVLPEDMAGTKGLRGDAPGPARSPETGGSPAPGGGYFCPFMKPSK